MSGKSSINPVQRTPRERGAADLYRWVKAYIFFGLLLLVAVLNIGCRKHDEVICPMLTCELRVVKAVSPDPKTTRVSLVTWSGESAHYLWGYNQTHQKEEGGLLLFRPDDFVLTSEPENRRTLIVGNPPGLAQVFRLSLPGSPKARDWSQWQRPDCLATGYVGWSVIYNQKIDVVSTSVPPDSFELRYKVEMRNLGPSYETMMKQKRAASE
jgi:hypothetical protein